MDCTDAPPSGTRAETLAAAARVGGGVIVAGALLASPTWARTARVPVAQAGALAFLLRLEQVQMAFYEAAAARPGIRGEPGRLAAAAAAHEAVHIERLRVLVRSPARAPRVDAGEALVHEAGFVRAATMLEDACVAAYNAEIPGLGIDAMLAATEIVSVDARHAAWARALAGAAPPAQAVDVTAARAAVMAAIAEAGIRVTG